MRLVDRGDLAVRVGDDGRPAGVGLLADANVERQRAEEVARRSRRHMRSPPPSPKMCSAWPQFEQMWIAMFSTMPRIGTPTFSNILRPLRASISAMSCGVVTITAPVTGTFCDERQLDVAGAGRQVDDQVVEVAPVGLAAAAARAPASPSARARPSACPASIRKPIDIACTP